MMFIWLLVIVLLVLYFEKNRNHSKYRTLEESPLEVLDKRYVSGEITEEEYKSKRELLKK